MNTWTSTWVNDHLDLYNYALSIGDSTWAANIIHKLKVEKENLLEQEHKALLLSELLSSYDRINNQLMEVFRMLRATTMESQTVALQQQWYTLKLLRIDVSRQILQYK